MKKMLFVICCMLTTSCVNAQKQTEKVLEKVQEVQNESKNKFYLLEKSTPYELSFVGYNNGSPVFLKYKDGYWLTATQNLYSLKQYAKDSMYVAYLRDAKYPVYNKKGKLLWIDDDLEIYTMRNEVTTYDENLIIVRGNEIDTVYIQFDDSWFEPSWFPFILTDNRRTLYMVQPQKYQDENLGWYYDNILKIDLTTKPLAVERLPITGTQMQLDGNYLYYKGGCCGKFENAILRVEIGKWDKIDTLAIYAQYWFVKDDILYFETGGYTGQDEWIGTRFEQKFVAYSIKEKKCAIVADESPSGDQQAFIFNGQFYIPYWKVIERIDIPDITEFPYKQTIPPH